MPTALLVVLSSLFITRTVVARITFNTIDRVGIVADQGRQVTVTGPIAVTAGERTELGETVTQSSTGAVAEGVIFLTGTGQTNQWEVTALTEARNQFGQRGDWPVHVGGYGGFANGERGADPTNNQAIAHPAGVGTSRCDVPGPCRAGRSGATIGQVTRPDVLPVAPLCASLVIAAR